MNTNNKNKILKNWKLVNFCEFDKYATRSYCAIHNVDESKNLGDITKVDENELDDFNMICGGSPCQDFSVAGKQKGSVWTCKDCGEEYNPLTVHWGKRNCCPNCDSENIEKTRSSLLVEYLRVVRVNKPNFGIYENVKNIVGKQFKDTTFKLFTDELEEYGYNVYWKVLNAKNYGVPQNRERVYLIFIKKDLDNGKFKFPKPFDNGLRLKDLLEDDVDEKFYISNEKTQKFIANIEEKYNKNKTDKFVCEERKDEGIRTFKGEVCGTLRTIDACGDKRVVEIDSPKFIGNVNREDFGTGYAGGVWDDSYVSPTLTTMQGGGRQPHIITGLVKKQGEEFAKETDYVNTHGMCGIRIRKLTPREAFRLMGFSDEDFDAAQKVEISNSQLYKQAGNSIVVDVLYYIYRELYIAMPYLFDDLKLSSFFSGIGAFEIGLDKLYKDINSGNFQNPQEE